MRLLPLAAALSGLFLSSMALGDEAVDLELVLLADASGSIDDGEIMLQRRGYAEAIVHQDVLRAITSGYRRRIVLTYVEWGQADSQAIVVPWMIVDGKQSAAEFAKRLMAEPRQAYGPNAIGSALALGHDLIEGNKFKGSRQVIDFSADSANSWSGVPVALARAQALVAGIVINGLAILCRSCNGRPVDYDVEAAFEETIVGGPGSFVITADDDKRFAEVVQRKLILEVASMHAE